MSETLPTGRLLEEALHHLKEAELAVLRLGQAAVPNGHVQATDAGLSTAVSLARNDPKRGDPCVGGACASNSALVQQAFHVQDVPDSVVIESERTIVQSDEVAEEDNAQVTSLIWVPSGFNFHIPMVHPESNRRLSWLAVGLAFTMMDAAFIPYTLAFEVALEGIVLRFIIDIYFLMDIVLSFMTGFQDHLGQIVVNPRRVWRSYMKSWFWFDLLAAFPWNWVEGLSGGPLSLTRSVRVIRALRLMRIMRILKLKSVIDKFEYLTEGNYLLMFVMGIMRVLGTLFIVCHWCSCMWFNVAVTEMASNPDAETWVTIKLPSEISELDYVAGHSSYYIWSLYFTMTTMTTVGYGDISPTSTREVRYALFFLAVSAVVFAGQMGVLSDLIANVNTQGKVMREQKTVLARYMNWRAVPRPLRASIRNFCVFLWETNEGNDAYEDELKDVLPPVLRRELCDHIYGGVLRGAPFLRWMADFPIVTKHLASAIENKIWEKGDCLFRYDTVCDTIHLLLSGQVRLTRDQPIEYQPAAVTHSFTVPRKGTSKKGVLSMEQIEEMAKEASHRSKKMLMRTSTSALSAAGAFVNNKKAGNQETQREENPLEDHAIGPIFRSEMFVFARNRMRHEDQQRHINAMKLQSRWRRWRKRQQGEAREGPSDSDWNRRFKSLPSISSHSIKAPAFFGESCLWHDSFFTSGTCTKTFGYSAVCEKLSETLEVPLADIQGLLDRFSPWLRDRFHKFRQDLLECRRQACPEGFGPMHEPKSEPPGPAGPDHAQQGQYSSHGESLPEGALNEQHPKERHMSKVAEAEENHMHHMSHLRQNHVLENSVGVHSHHQRSMPGDPKYVAGMVAGNHTLTPRTGLTPRSRNDDNMIRKEQWRPAGVGTPSNEEVNHSVLSDSLKQVLNRPRSTTDSSVTTNGSSAARVNSLLPMAPVSSRGPVNANNVREQGGRPIAGCGGCA